MGRLWNKWLVPALFAVILFLCIRVANDIPKHEYYWESNEWNFMLKDMLVVLFMSYPIFFLLSIGFVCAGSGSWYGGRNTG